MADVQSSSVGTVVETNVKQGAVIGGFICFGLALMFMALSLFTFVIYVPLLIASFVLSIVAMAQKRTVGGIILLLMTIIVPPVLGIVLTVYRTSAALAQARATAHASPHSAASPVSASTTAPSDPEAAAAKAYTDKVVVRNIQVGHSTLDQPGVFGEVRNSGDRSLDEVEITIYFLDRNGQRIHEKTYHPVLVSQFSFGDSNTPLKPGYSRKFGVRADDAPQEWGHKVEVAVTSVRFSNQ